ncbi:MAG: YjbH domain-containing protein, partial [Pseudomonadota bacterium]|nr:YjbH domain-containing protein [Pseudomonadota bacterium]
MTRNILNFIKMSSFLKVCILCIFFSLQLSASIDDYLPQDVGPTSTRYGGIGLIEIPTARFVKEGNLRLGITSSWPYEVTALTAAPFEWMEATYRYTEIKNQLYSNIPSFSGNQSLKDKGFDFRFRLLEERTYLPQVSIGLRDLAGTGLFSGEYIVASKRFWDLDLTAGIGWGALAGKTAFSNPLIRVSERFRSRTGEQGAGGDFSFDDWFSGDRISFFGGFEYALPYRGWRLKVDYDTSNLVNEPWIETPYNFSVASGYKDMIEYSVGLKGGKELLFSFFVKGDFGTGSLVPKFDPPIKLTSPNEKDKNRLAQDTDLLFGSLNANLAVAKIYNQGISMVGDELIITINQGKFRSQPRAIGRSIRVASMLAPAHINYITINVMNADIEVSSVTVRRDAFTDLTNFKGSIAEVSRNAIIQSPDQHWKKAQFQHRVIWPEIRTNVAPALKNMIGGP